MKNKIDLIIGLFILIASISLILIVVPKLDNREKIKTSYEIGFLSTIDGKPIESRTTLYTKDVIKADAIDVEIDFEARLTYLVYWYDELGNLVSVSEEYTINKTFYRDENAYGCRLLIKPNLTDDVTEIKWYDKYSYVKKINVYVSNVNDEDRILTANIKISSTETYELLYKKGMTWEEVVEFNYDLYLRNGCVSSYKLDRDIHYWRVQGENYFEGSASLINLSDVFDPTRNYSLGGQLVS